MPWVELWPADVNVLAGSVTRASDSSALIFTGTGRRPFGDEEASTVRMKAVWRGERVGRGESARRVEEPVKVQGSRWAGFGWKASTSILVHIFDESQQAWQRELSMPHAVC